MTTEQNRADFPDIAQLVDEFRAEGIPVKVLNQDAIKEHVSYNEETGVFTRKKTISNRIKIGQIAGTITKNGYLSFLIEGRRYYAHRLAWIYKYGCWPSKHIDHINGIRHDNRIINLRDVSRSINLHNINKPKKNSKSGVLGVSWSKQKNKWIAQIMLNRKSFNLGFFNSIKDASDAYLKAKNE